MIKKMIEAQEGYKGFIHIHCERCGQTRGFYTRELITESYCKNCHKKIRLEDLKPLWMHCECGNRMRYMTNHTHSVFDIKCIDCGNPVAVWWNEKKGLYETIREETEAKGRRKRR